MGVDIVIMLACPVAALFCEAPADCGTSPMLPIVGGISKEVFRGWSLDMLEIQNSEMMCIP